MFFTSFCSKKNNGMSLMEVLIAIAIMTILGSVSVSVFSGLARNSSLDRDATIVESYIQKAHTMSINSVDSVVHGVYFTADKVSVFKTETYSAGNTESYYDVPGKSLISGINLTGGGSSLYFDKLTGAPNKSGTIIMTSSDGAQTKTIKIYATGIVEMQ